MQRAANSSVPVGSLRAAIWKGKGKEVVTEVDTDNVDEELVLLQLLSKDGDNLSHIGLTDSGADAVVDRSELARDRNIPEGAGLHINTSSNEQNLLGQHRIRKLERLYERQFTQLWRQINHLKDYSLPGSSRLPEFVESLEAELLKRTTAMNERSSTIRRLREKCAQARNYPKSYGRYAHYTGKHSDISTSSFMDTHQRHGCTPNSAGVSPDSQDPHYGISLILEASAQRNVNSKTMLPSPPSECGIELPRLLPASISASSSTSAPVENSEDSTTPTSTDSTRPSSHQQEQSSQDGHHSRGTSLPSVQEMLKTGLNGEVRTLRARKSNLSRLPSINEQLGPRHRPYIELSHHLDHTIARRHLATRFLDFGCLRYPTLRPMVPAWLDFEFSEERARSKLSRELAEEIERPAKRSRLL